TAPKGADVKDARAELAQARAQVTELRVRGPEGTEVFLAGDRRGVVPLVLHVAPGSHLVEGRGKDGEDTTIKVSAAPGETRLIDLDLDLDQPPTGPRGWIIAGGVVSSGALLGLGAALRFVGSTQEQQASQRLAGTNGCIMLNRAECQEAQHAFTGLDATRTVSTAAMIAGASLAAVTFVYTFYPRERVAVSTKVGTGLTIEASW
ncbi:MAG TPA: hypothetical protein VLS89_17845, partial [Candidatus Nanopelagicales bacterium]|nr:hypothetical protein [Candidatus Nanopelagicales bacterium]